MRRFASARTRGSALLLGAALVVASCKTQDAGTEPRPVDGDSSLTIGQGARDRDETQRVPVSLWSPTQRRSTASYYFLVAEYIAMKERDAKKALPVYEAAYGLDPNPFLGGKMLQAKAASGDRAEALIEARKMVLLYPRDQKLRYFYGDMLAQGGKFAEAADELERAVELDPKMETSYVELIEVYESAKQPAKALVVARELTKNMPGSVAGWSILSRLLLAQNNHKDALVPARRAWEMQSNNPSLAQVYAIVLQLNGKTKQAVRIYEQLYRLDPTDEETTARMIELYRQVGNLEDALTLLDEMLKKGGEGGTGKPAVAMQKAIVLWELKRFKEASDLLNKLAVEYPDSDRLKYLAAIGLDRLENYPAALTAYELVPDNSPFRYHADFRRVVIMKELKRFDEALALGTRLMGGTQADWDLYGMMAGIYSEQKKYKDAVQLATAGYDKFPQKPRLLFLKGVYQEKEGDRSGCIETMKAVIEKDPANSSAFNFLGYMYVEKGENLDEAENLIRRALELKPDDGFYLDSLGWLFYQRKDYDKASQYLQKAVKIEPTEGVIMEHLGDVMKLKGDAKGALGFYESSLKTNLEVKDRARIEDKVREFKKAGG